MAGRLIAGLCLVAAPLAAQLPEGWTGRADRGEASGIKFVAMAPGFHVTPGASGIVYRVADKAAGNFHAIGSFTQTKAPSHPEAYGMFLSGNNLTAENQSYIYFLIRGDGKYLVKKRDGATTANIVGWTDHEAIQKQDAAGKSTNQIEIDANGPKVVFKVNGKAVYEMEAPNRGGQVGLRINHGLDLHIANFDVHH
jgi:hypothetical protein